MSWPRKGVSVHRYLLAAFIGLVIAVVSVLLFTNERRRAQLRTEESFRILANDRMYNFFHQVEQNLRTLDYLGVWYYAEIKKGAKASEQEFMAEFQLLAHQLFPVVWVEPAEEFRELLDTDLFPRPDYRRLLEEARDRGETRATGPVPCPEGEGHEFDVWLFTPLYRTAAVPTSVAERCAALAGFLVMTLDIKDMMDSALKELASAEIDLFLLDEDAPPENQVFCRPENSTVRDPRVPQGKECYLEGMRAGADDFITKPFDESASSRADAGGDANYSADSLT